VHASNEEGNDEDAEVEGNVVKEEDHNQQEDGQEDGVESESS
jgi:hypothetical protein